MISRPSNIVIQIESRHGRFLMRTDFSEEGRQRACAEEDVRCLPEACSSETHFFQSWAELVDFLVRVKDEPPPAKFQEQNQGPLVADELPVE